MLAPGPDVAAPSAVHHGVMRVNRLDHLVLTVADMETSVRFYTEVLGMQELTFEGRTALAFGTSKINLHQAGREFEPKAQAPTPGSGDVCLVVDDSLDDVVAELAEAGVEIEEGPVDRTGALGTIRSVYLRDPDANLVELSVYVR